MPEEAIEHSYFVCPSIHRLSDTYATREISLYDSIIVKSLIKIFIKIYQYCPKLIRNYIATLNVGCHPNNIDQFNKTIYSIIFENALNLAKDELMYIGDVDEDILERNRTKITAIFSNKDPYITEEAYVKISNICQSYMIDNIHSFMKIDEFDNAKGSKQIAKIILL